MAAVNIVSRMGAAYVGEESTYLTTPSMNRAFLLDTPTFETNRAELEVPDFSVKMHDHRSRIQAIKSGTVNVSYALRPHTNKYDKDASPADYWEAQLLQSAFGGHTQAAGSLVVSGSTTSVVVTGGQGSRFAKGQWIGVETGVSGGTIEYALVTQISTDTLTLFPTLAAAPFATGVVYNGDNFHLTETYTTSLAMQIASAQQAADSHTFNGGRCDSIEFSTELGQIMRVNQKFAFTDWTGPSDQSISVAVGTDNTRSHMALHGATVLFQATATTTRTAYPVESFKLTLNPGMMHVPSLGSSGTLGVMKVAPRLSSGASLKFRFDSAIDSSFWTSQTDVQCIVIVPVGTGVTQRAVIFDIGCANVSPKPVISDEGGRAVMTVQLTPKLDTRVTSASTDLGFSNVRIALI